MKFKRGYYAPFIEIDLDNMGEFITKVEAFLQAEQEILKNSIEEDAKRLPQDEQEWLWEWHVDDFGKLNKIFPQTLRTSLFTTIYSYFEHRLNEACRILKRQTNQQLDIKDITGQGIVRAQSYLKKVMNVDFPDNSQQWNDIMGYNVIRNLIVHNDGELGDNETSKKVKAFVQGKTSVQIIDDKLQLQQEFCIGFIKTINGFMDSLVEEINKKYHI